MFEHGDMLLLSFLDSIDELNLTLGKFDQALKRFEKSLKGQLGRVFDLMKDGQWRTIPDVRFTVEVLSVFMI